MPLVVESVFSIAVKSRIAFIRGWWASKEWGGRLEAKGRVE